MNCPAARLSLRHTALAWLLLGMAASVAVAARTLVPLTTDWQFTLTPPGGDWLQPAAVTTGWNQITLPHTWNAQDGQDGSPSSPAGNYYRGDGYYRTQFTTDAAWSGRVVFVEFDAVNRFAEVWLNGRLLGRHAGGHARFRLELTAALAPVGGVNLLAVKANNEIGRIIPTGGDFTQFGGIYRPARLVITDPVHVALRDLGSPGVYLHTRELTANHARIEARVMLENDHPAPQTVTLTATIQDAAGQIVAQAATPVLVPGGAGCTQALTWDIAHPRLWQGRADPYLYRVLVRVEAGDGRVLDHVEQPLGLRTIRFDPALGCLLNEQSYPLRGVSRHQDRQDQGYALSPADEQRDLQLITELGANSIRLSHYQQSATFHSLCDAVGVLLYAEVGYVARPVFDDEAFFANAEQQLRELIRQNFNHPAIFTWGLGNETDKDQPAIADRLLARLALVARAEDPDRPTTYASHHDDDDPRNFRSDLLGVNKYYGWYGGDSAQLATWLDGFHARHPDRLLGLSEYGAGASIYQHEENAPARATKSPWHPEEWQSRYHEENWAIITARPWLWGTFVWNMFDFAADHRAEGDTLGRNDKGLVTYDRQTRKDAFYFYKAHWNPAPMAHLVSKRHSLRQEASTTVKVYSNCDTVELWLNEKPLGVRQVPGDKIVRWPGVTLAPGPNRLRILGRRGNAEVADSCSWVYAAGTPYRPKDAQTQDYSPWLPPESSSSK
jgi:beta-galactosidase